LQLSKFIGDVIRQQVATGREDLAEFDEDGAEVFKAATDALTACGLDATEPGPWRKDIQKAQRP